MTDRELLELAAKAAAVKNWWDGDCSIRSVGSTYWNPIEDDGDALRLRNKLSAMIIDEGNCAFVAIYRSNIPSIEIREMYIGDLEGGYASDSSVSAATRRAIVRAAASIGEQIK